MCNNVCVYVCMFGLLVNNVCASKRVMENYTYASKYVTKRVCICSVCVCICERVFV